MEEGHRDIEAESAYWVWKKGCKIEDFHFEARKDVVYRRNEGLVSLDRRCSTFMVGRISYSRQPVMAELVCEGIGFSR